MQPAAVSPDRLASLLSRMTLEEKVGQMTQVTLDILTRPRNAKDEAARLDPEKLSEAVGRVGVGSIFNVAGRPLAPSEWRGLIDEIQQAAAETRLGIPVLFGLDAVHGSGYTEGATIFPHNLNLAATWRPEFARQAARVTAIELAACSVPWNFSPVLDVGRTPLWSRFVETFGEDVLMATEFGVAAVQGYRDVPGVSACAKHFVGYSGPATGRDRTTAVIPDGELWDTYLPPFRAAIRAGVRTVMVNSGDVNGYPVHASQRLLTDVLRGQLGFEGVIVSDWEDVIKLHTIHRVASSVREAVLMSVRAGLDMSMTPYEYGFAAELIALVRDGQIPESRVDESVRRILALKQDLGLFAEVREEVEVLEPAERIRLSRDAASASLVLLENKGVLPISAGSELVVSGIGADSLPALCGPWTHTWQGDDDSTYPTHLNTIRDEFRKHSSLRLVEVGQGPSPLHVICLAEASTVEKPGDISDLALDPGQVDHVLAALDAAHRVVIVLLCDRPRLLGDWVNRCEAVVWAGRPGPYGASAIVELLIGEGEAEGRLPFTYPSGPAEIVPYDHRSTDRVGLDYGLNPDWKFDGLRPRWQFGHGLSYTSFTYEDLQAVLDDKGVDVRVTLRNTGGRSAREVVQVYLTDAYASKAPRVERLAAFRSVCLGPGDEQRIQLHVPKESLGFHGDDGFVIEPGEFQIRVKELVETVHFGAKGEDLKNDRENLFTGT